MRLRGYNVHPKMISFEGSIMGWWLVPPSWIRHFASLTIIGFDLQIFWLFLFPFFPRFVYIFSSISISIYSTVTIGEMQAFEFFSIFLSFYIYFIQNCTQFSNPFFFFMPSFSELIRVQSNPGIKRTPRLQKMAYYNLITISKRLHTRRSRVGVSKLQRRNEKHNNNKN